MKLGILTSHPIQYQTPWFRALADSRGVDLTVFFCTIPDAEQQGFEFGIPFQWDIPLLEGYRYRVLRNVARSPTSSTFRGCDTPELLDIVHEEDFDAFVVNGWHLKSYLQLLVACRRYDVPCMVRGDSNDLRRRPLWKRMFHRFLLMQYDAMLYVGESNRRFYLSNGVPEDKLFRAPHCVDNERFAAAASSFRAKRREIRAGWAIPPNATVFLYCGKFVPKKRPLDCLLALRAALHSSSRSCEDMHLLMVGSGELLDECRTEAGRLGLPVSFAGFLNQGEIARAYAVADSLVLPSDDGETWGLVVNEAMACGLPAIVSDRVGCHADLVTDGETGFVFPLGDTNGLGESMAGLASDPNQLGAMGANARKRVARYSYAEVVAGTFEAANTLRAAGARRRSAQ